MKQPFALLYEYWIMCGEEPEPEFIVLARGEEAGPLIEKAERLAPLYPRREKLVVVEWQPLSRASGSFDQVRFEIQGGAE